MSKGNLFILSGPSGTGKGTICNELVKNDDIFLSVSLTTRDKRNEEIEGVTYFYTTVEDFKNRVDNDLMLEWAQYGENFYGTPREIIEEKLNSGINVILEIEVQGAIQVKQKLPEATMIFILPPSVEALKERLVSRDRESREEILKRMEISKRELSKAHLYDYIIINGKLDECIEAIKNIITDRQAKLNFAEQLKNSL